MKNAALFISLIFLSVACATVPQGFMKIDKDLLTEKTDEIFNDTLFSHAHWGVLIKSLENGNVIYERNSDKMFMPASNEKIPTAAAALTKLGPDFRFETVIGYDGSIIDSVLNGDLILVGDGDPTISDRIYEKTTTLFERWADSLRILGIDSINGNIIGDDNKFDNVHIGFGWPHSGLDYWYSAEFGALQLNENYIDLAFFPPSDSIDTLRIVPDVESSYYRLIKEIEITDTGKTSLSITSEFGTNDIVIKGKIKKGSEKFERSPTITNPTKFYATVFKEVLQKKGIGISGQALDCDEVTDYPDSLILTDTLLINESIPLAEILKVLMKKSQNLYAETLVRILGLNKSGKGTFIDGRKVVEEVLNDFGIMPDTYAYMDGSGLSRYNFISPRQIVKILEGMIKGEYREIWYDIQPIAGIDGTLKYRMRGTKAEDNVRAKTGTISNVRGLSGYVKTAEGEELVFSFLVNGHLRSSRETELITDKVLELISEFPVVNTSFFN
jgi:D-alanyl-D-alanine carboxypeptidase/D-alanyl-D-alanine-endopeptidase (penicillin-binding protein 4)